MKFTAPSLSLPVGLDVGRHVFSVFDKVQWLLLVTLFIIVYSRPRAVSGTLIGLVLAIQLLQSQWLLPVLNERAVNIMAGMDMPGSWHHFLFGLLELLKLVLLLLFAWRTVRFLESTSA